jgi:glycosyltransferase involved in cell wall biosynthesis
MERQLRHVDVFFAQSEFSRRKHEAFGFRHEMEVMAPFLPDSDAPTEERRERRVGEAPTSPFVLFAGRLERMKGLDDILLVWGEEAPADLVVAGDGPHRARLEALAAESTRVRFLGRIPNERVIELMREALAVLVPSTGYETFGFTAVEAFRAGTPVVARRRGPLPELVQKGGGLLFGTATEARSAVRRLVEEPELRRRLGEAGRRAFEATWSEEVVVPRYIARIERLLAEREPGAHDRADA